MDDLRTGKGLDNFVISIFARYIIHAQHSDNKDQNPQDWQPTPTEVDEYFSRPENQKGVILADLHRHFIDVKNIPELLRRVSRFATFENHTQAPGQELPDESTYIRKPVPSREDITQILEEHDDPVDFPQLLRTHFPDGVGSELAVWDILLDIAAPDLTTGNWLLKTQQCPDSLEVRDIFEDQAQQGMSLDGLVAEFPDRIWDQDQFVAVLKEIAFESDDGVWIPRVKDGEEQLLDVATSKIVRALRLQLEEEPLKVLGWVEAKAGWDQEKKTFVEKEVVALPTLSPKAEAESLVGQISSLVKQLSSLVDESGKWKRGEDEDEDGEEEVESPPATKRQRRRATPSSRRFAQGRI
jgi:hypothetical protein